MKTIDIKNSKHLIEPNLGLLRYYKFVNYLVIHFTSSHLLSTVIIIEIIIYFIINFTNYTFIVNIC